MLFRVLDLLVGQSMLNEELDSCLPIDSHVALLRIVYRLQANTTSLTTIQLLEQWSASLNRRLYGTTPPITVLDLSQTSIVPNGSNSVGGGVVTDETTSWMVAQEVGL